jgi:hypothetical protein
MEEKPPPGLRHRLTDIRRLSLLFLPAIPFLACQSATPNAIQYPTASPTATKNGGESIPPGAVKGSPENDFWPPAIAAGWSKPIPLGAPVDTAGGEDRPFVTPDGDTLYFFFTPDVNVPAEKSILDGVSGIWMSRRSGGGWSEPERVPLETPGQTALDGCEMIIGDRMYFCSARMGNVKTIQWYYATLKEGAWSNWTDAGQWMNQNVDGEMHITTGYRDIYFASKRASGQGGFDLWVAHSTPDGWGEAENLGLQVNSAADENRPFISLDGQELWFDSSSRKGKPGPATFRCLRQADGTWGACQEIISSFAGEPNLTGDGKTLYFIHHYYSADLKQMIEADIYVSSRQ